MSAEIQTHDELENWLQWLPVAEASEGLVAPDKWLPDSADKANWLLQKLAAVEEEDAADEETAKREIARIELWLAREKEKRAAKRKWLANSLEWYTREQFAMTGKQSVCLPHGTLSLRKPAPRIRLADLATPLLTLEWLKANLPQAIKVAESIRFDALKSLCVKPEPGAGVAEAVIKETGEIVPGVVLEIAADMTFSVSADGGVK